MNFEINHFCEKSHKAEKRILELEAENKRLRAVVEAYKEWSVAEWETYAEAQAADKLDSALAALEEGKNE